MNWGVAEVITWLHDSGLGQYQPSFQRLRIDGRELVLLTRDELGKSGLGLSSEHQVRRNLRSESSSPNLATLHPEAGRACLRPKYILQCSNDK